MWAVGNNLNRAYDYFQDFCKCLSIFNKATNLQKNRKTEIKEGEETYLAAAHLAAQHYAGPCQPAASGDGYVHHGDCILPRLPRFQPFFLRFSGAHRREAVRAAQEPEKRFIRKGE